MEIIYLLLAIIVNTVCWGGLALLAVSVKYKFVRKDK